MLALKVEPTMKPIQKDELFTHLGQFLKGKGIELKEGSYANCIQKSCGLLTDAINLSQAGVQKARDGIDNKLDQMRQVIHEKTAPKPPVVGKTAAQTRAAGPKATAGKSAARKRTAKTTKAAAAKAKA